MKGITKRTNVRILKENDESWDTDVTISFDPKDPFAMYFTFHVLPRADCDADVTWTVSRELFVTGTRKPIGYGDVAMCPGKLDWVAVLGWLLGGRRHLYIRLCGEDGTVFIYRMSLKVARWVARRMEQALPMRLASNVADIEADFAFRRHAY